MAILSDYIHLIKDKRQYHPFVIVLKNSGDDGKKCLLKKA
jgi:hypothetical protein